MLSGNSGCKLVILFTQRRNELAQQCGDVTQLPATLLQESQTPQDPRNTLNLIIKPTSSALNTGASSYKFNSSYDSGSCLQHPATIGLCPTCKRPGHQVTPIRQYRSISTCHCCDGQLKMISQTLLLLLHTQLQPRVHKRLG